MTLVAYARFADAHGGLLCGGANLSDDIIYDPFPPNLSISVRPSAAGACETLAPGQVTLLVDAADQDGGSGLADIRAGTQSQFGQAAWQPFTSSLPVAAEPGAVVQVQVRDGAGNLSAIASATVPEVGTIYVPLVQR